MSNEEQSINLNRSQTNIQMVNPNVLYGLLPRAGGKTYLIGERIEHLNDVMPRSQILLFADTFKRIEERIIPNIESYFVNEVGMIEGEDFVRFRKPPSYFVKPLIPLNNYEHVVSFSSGMVLCCASQMVSGSANAYNAQALIVDEAKYIDEVVINTEVLPALRGNAKFFGHLPEYRSHWYFTDKYGENIKWLLAKKKNWNEKLTTAVRDEQAYIIWMRSLMHNFTQAEQIKYKKELAWREARLQKIRSYLVYFCEGQAYENIATLGKKYFRDLKRDLGEYEYLISVENKDPETVRNTFYPGYTPNKQLYKLHKDQTDTTERDGLIVAMDYQWRITPMVVGQFGTLPGREDQTFNIVNAIHTIHPKGGIKKTVKAFCDYYKDRNDKLVFYVYDHTATERDADYPSKKETAVQAWLDNGWRVAEIHMGKAPDHGLKYEEIKDVMLLDKILFNEITADPLLKSIKNAGAIKSGNVTKKDKSQEKKNNDPVEQTDYSDAYDMLVFAVLVMGLVKSAKH